MEIVKTAIAGCLLLKPRIYRDERGWFYESFNAEVLRDFVPEVMNFVQDNRSCSAKHVLRGLHFQQAPHAQAKIIQVIQGKVRDAVVDLRKDSPTYLQHFVIELDASDHQLMYIPAGLAHGFLSLEDETVFQYKCSAFYNPESESGIRFDDPDLALDWGVGHDNIRLSGKDRDLPSLKEVIG
ncbi:dTDP-4-dehydrorhamnose 3,5-epimerase [Robiginitalea myxolifaciens]|uniref:dTDP-4-dehydrorhamnose 3,5-epimerase n=1 Tax=Robiginitalea myxolifaciens TaxID=400055 RepID=A0A1I6G2N7_9FLAO|nr:dTDP-4-dehydrorhamnose 3,5-epimerase [Robiginitalea myxolifaciens]SFR36449.1 dTDP-4-dehydrorhamnose 3,5-epimerase [Robiginitalea myxolifaciens]